jgi:transposase
MDILTDSHYVSRLEVVDTGRRRRWTSSEKLRIVEESFSGSRRASETARRYGISNTLLFAWRKAYREGRIGDAAVAGFVPATIVGEPQERSRSPGRGRMVIVSGNGRRVIVGPDVDVSALLRVLQALETL